MINKNGNDGMNDGFDDEPLDDFEGEFADADFDESVIDDAEFSDLPDDGEYGEDDFEGGEWEEEQPPAKGKKEKSLYKTGEKPKLSFNTIVIIGAVVVGGGVMAFTIMNKSAEVAANKKSIFQSVLNIGGVMDGTLFGDKEAEPTPEEQAAQNAQAQQEGFLSNPDLALPENTNAPQDGNPPQPVPFSPEELANDINQPLTPMPEGTVGAMPRGPDEALPEAQNDVAVVGDVTQAVPAPAIVEEEAPAGEASAKDLLEAAIANREKKTQEKEETEIGTDVKEPASVVETSPAPVLAEPKAEETPVPVPAPVAAAPSVDPAAVAAVSEAAQQNSKAVVSLEAKIDTLLKRMEQIESDLGNVRESRQSASQELEAEIATLKKEIVAIREKPAPAPVQEKAAVKAEPAAAAPLEEEDETAPPPVQEKPKPAPVKKKRPSAAPAPKTQAAKAPSNNARWELRAAQPGRAWVSRPGERDMQSVEVGQTLPNVGRITAITYQNGRWTVTGTQGQIRQ